MMKDLAEIGAYNSSDIFARIVASQTKIKYIMNRG